jgi:hypothetical protein
VSTVYLTEIVNRIGEDQEIQTIISDVVSVVLQIVSALFSYVFYSHKVAIFFQHTNVIDPGQKNENDTT